jgi:hypothetical protein
MAYESPRRRRRIRRESGEQADSGAAPAEVAALTNSVLDPGEESAASLDDDRDTERGLRGLVGGGSSQVRVGAAMRARDATRPSAEDMTATEANLIIIRRGWTPPPGSR